MRRRGDSPFGLAFVLLACVGFAATGACQPKRAGGEAAEPPMADQAEGLDEELAAAERTGGEALAAARAVRAGVESMPADPPPGSLAPIGAGLADRVEPRVEETVGHVTRARRLATGVISAAVQIGDLRRALAERDAAIADLEEANAALEAEHASLLRRTLVWVIVGCLVATLAAGGGGAALLFYLPTAKHVGLGLLMAAAIGAVGLVFSLGVYSMLDALSRWGVYLVLGYVALGTGAVAWVIVRHWDWIKVYIKGGEAAKAQIADTLAILLEKAGVDPSQIAEIVSAVRRAFNTAHASAQAAAGTGGEMAVAAVKHGP